MLTYLIIATALGVGPAPKDNDEAFKPSEVAARALRLQLEAMNGAALRDDDAAVVRAMYPRVVRAMGGPREAQRKVEAARLSLKADGAKPLAATVGDVRGCAKARAQIQCVVEGSQVIRVSGGRLLAQTETLAFSSEGGAHWTFLAGGQDPATLRATLPELSPTLPLRRAPAPTFERD